MSNNLTGKTSIIVQSEDFSVPDLYSHLASSGDTGGVVMFVGLVRDFAHVNTSSNGDSNAVFELEHYPGMTERNIESIVEDAFQRWPLQAVSVVHRVGKLSINDQIVFVGVSSAHRAEAFSACDFIMDYLKSRAAFWKKETVDNKGKWVEAKDQDELSLNRWK
ncbi:molybdopterin synthase catalytic subunit MoaE [Marinomonas balearica]|uniref:Molybdopterin synthase catalytic subunit n=1 Tax=Marinomonas balearica TaxID=491947 RepID=A0A4R6MF91_9GAMM|nr:molybdopterin synthase catalytic subunit MoaE [Marinomonas balearica]TDO99975.1 molybdopterin synthase subunit MoaE [Marinomonas balearica]